jgi:hypothetical protein
MMWYAFALTDRTVCDLELTIIRENIPPKKRNSPHFCSSHYIIIFVDHEGIQLKVEE